MIKNMYWVEEVFYEKDFTIFYKADYKVVKRLTLFNKYAWTDSIFGPFTRKEDAEKLRDFLEETGL